jgi:hypothetical protein
MKKQKRAKTKSKATKPLHEHQPYAPRVDIGANENRASVPWSRPLPNNVWKYWTIANLVFTSWLRIQEITKAEPRPFGDVIDARGKFSKL